MPLYNITYTTRAKYLQSVKRTCVTYSRVLRGGGWWWSWWWWWLSNRFNARFQINETTRTVLLMWWNKAALVGGMLQTLQIACKHWLSCFVTLLHALLYMRTVRRSSRCMWVESSLSSIGFSVRVIIVFVTSERLCNAVHPVFFPVPTILDVTSQPVNARKKERKCHAFIITKFFSDFMNWYIFMSLPVPNPIHNSSKPRRLNWENKYMPINTSESTVRRFMSIHNCIVKMKHHTSICFLMIWWVYSR